MKNNVTNSKSTWPKDELKSEWRRLNRRMKRIVAEGRNLIDRGEVDASLFIRNVEKWVQTYLRLEEIARIRPDLPVKAEYAKSAAAIRLVFKD